jgi:hypothetical protein
MLVLELEFATSTLVPRVPLFGDLKTPQDLCPCPCSSQVDPARRTMSKEHASHDRAQPARLSQPGLPSLSEERAREPERAWVARWHHRAKFKNRTPPPLCSTHPTPKVSRAHRQTTLPTTLIVGVITASKHKHSAMNSILTVYRK